MVTNTLKSLRRLLSVSDIPIISEITTIIQSIILDSVKLQEPIVLNKLHLKYTIEAKVQNRCSRIYIALGIVFILLIADPILLSACSCKTLLILKGILKHCSVLYFNNYNLCTYVRSLGAGEQTLPRHSGNHCMA